jgi:hypothetical protein
MDEKNKSKNFERFSCIIIEKKANLSTHGKAKILWKKDYRLADYSIII